jgi:hypothetical protein
MSGPETEGAAPVETVAAACVPQPSRQHQIMYICIYIYIRFGLDVRFGGLCIVFLGSAFETAV